MPRGSTPGSRSLEPEDAVGSADRTGDNAERFIEPEEPIEKRFIVRFAAGPELVKQIDAARALLSFKLPANASLAQVLGAVLSEFIERNDPSRRAARRVKRAKSSRPKGRKGKNEKKNTRSSDSRVGARNASTLDRPPCATNPRAIPAAVRDAVLADSDGRCEYVSSSGRRCDATMHLQIDHIVPIARGGTSARANLRVLCGRHNRVEAERLLGICPPRIEGTHGMTSPITSST